MAWREKTAWLSLAAIIMAYGLYFSQVSSTRSTPAMLVLFGTVAAVQAIAMIAGSIILAARAGREALAKPDERDRAIDRRAARIAYFVLLVGMILVGVVMPFNKQGWQITNAAVLAVVVAEVVRYGIVAASYRRGWHG